MVQRGRDTAQSEEDTDSFLHVSHCFIHCFSLLIMHPNEFGALCLKSVFLHACLFIIDSLSKSKENGQILNLISVHFLTLGS